MDIERRAINLVERLRGRYSRDIPTLQRALRRAYLDGKREGAVTVVNRVGNDVDSYGDGVTLEALDVKCLLFSAYEAVLKP